MRLCTSVMICASMLALAACGGVRAETPPKSVVRVDLPPSLSRTNRVCRWSESTGNPAPVSAPPVAASLRHKHVSIVNWKLIQEKTWFRMYPRMGSVIRFNPELSYGEIVDPAADFNDMELLDFRALNTAKPPATIRFDGTAAQLCDEDAPASPGEYYDGPFMLGVQPLQNAEATNISEHVIVYAPLEVMTKDGGEPRNWFVLMIWHVRSAEECAKLAEAVDKESCLAILEIADLETGEYATRAPELLRKVKYPYTPSATRSHNGVIHGSSF